MGTTMFLVHTRVLLGLRQELQTRGYSMARSIGAVATPSLLAYNYSALQLAAEAASNDLGVVYVVIHDKEGGVAGAAGRSPVEGTRAAQAVGVVGSRVASTIRVPRQGRGIESVLHVSVPVFVEGVGEPWGSVHVGLSHDLISVELRRLDLALLVLGLTLAAVAVASGRWLARRITAPMRDLVQGTEALSAGDMSHRIPLSGPREMADLAGAFNVMMDRIQEKARESEAFQEALGALNTSLERQVRERTAAFQESVAQYKTLVDHSPDMILIVQDGLVRFVNRSFMETFGIAEAEALDPDFDLSRIFEPSSSALARGRITGWEGGRTAGSVEVLGKDQNGEVRHLELRGSRIEYRGRPAAECLLIDTTEAKRLRERLSDTEKLRSLGELAGGVAHDFNNLLGAILGRAQLLRGKGQDGDTDHDLAVIEKAALDGRETVRRIQEFSRTRRDKRFTAVDLGEILRDAVEMTRTRWSGAPGAPIEVQVDTPAVPPVLGNASELREVFTNLILNAVDAMPQGGRVDVSCRLDGETLVARVADTGSGMTEDIRRHLFDPFFTTKGTKGMGLGMSVAYGIVTRHGGQIDVATALGHGTVFTLRFDVADEDLVIPAGGDGAALAPYVRPGRILVIDDEPEILAILRDVLHGAGHHVRAALSGREGVQLAHESVFDLVFTDLGMPDMSGWDVATRIRELRSGVPIVLVTGWGATLDEAEARQRGIEAIVHKPFEIEELVRVAATLLLRVQGHVAGGQGAEGRGDD